MVEQTLVLIKPDATKREIWLQIIDHYKQAGFFIKKTRLIPKMRKKDVRKFYHVHKDKPFFGRLVDFMSSGPAIALLIEGQNVVEEIRKLNGSTDPKKAEKKTIRKEFGKKGGEKHENAVHASDSLESAQREIKIFFSDK
ncbi:nucleoside-diphosphate kinase [bacterium]|nr:nucleoside-diphosphate kinase [bacterium]|tara:strand:+ start:10086 stop:10505 length:420 start_codon:yes stop_codon:yes gene_type:complete